MMLSLRTQKLGYAMGTAGCVAGTVVAIFWGLRPVETSNGKHGLRTEKKTAIAFGTNSEDRLPSTDDFAHLWDRPLRHPLYDPPPPKVEVKQPAPMRVEVVGTILEDANSMALVRGEKGGVEYKHVGDTVGPTDNPGKLVEIGADAIVVQRAAERITLKVNDKEVR